MAKFVGSLMRDYLLFAVPPTLLPPSSHEAAVEGAPVAGRGLLLPSFARGNAAAGAAVRLPAVAPSAEGKQLIALTILALDETRRDHTPPPASKKLDGRGGPMRNVRRRDACPATDRGPGGLRLQALLLCSRGAIVRPSRSAGKLYATPPARPWARSKPPRAVQICALFEGW